MRALSAFASFRCISKGFEILARKLCERFLLVFIDCLGCFYAFDGRYCAVFGFVIRRATKVLFSIERFVGSFVVKLHLLSGIAGLSSQRQRQNGGCCFRFT